MILTKVLILIKEHVKSLAANAVVMVGDADQLQTARNGSLHHVLGLIRAAERIIGMRMKIL
jgi:hypothetical protein